MLLVFSLTKATVIFFAKSVTETLGTKLHLLTGVKEWHACKGIVIGEQSVREVTNRRAWRHRTRLDRCRGSNHEGVDQGRSRAKLQLVLTQLHRNWHEILEKHSRAVLSRAKRLPPVKASNYVWDVRAFTGERLLGRLRYLAVKLT